MMDRIQCAGPALVRHSEEQFVELPSEPRTGHDHSDREDELARVNCNSISRGGNAYPKHHEADAQIPGYLHVPQVVAYSLFFHCQERAEKELWEAPVLNSCRWRSWTQRRRRLRRGNRTCGLLLGIAEVGIRR